MDLRPWVWMCSLEDVLNGDRGRRRHTPRMRDRRPCDNLATTQTGGGSRG